MKFNPPRSLFVALLALTLSFLLPLAAHATDRNWTASGTGDWFAPGNWNAALPGTGDDAYIDNSGTAVIPSGSFGTPMNIYVGYRGTGGLIISGSASNSYAYLGFVKGSQGSVTVNGSGYWNNSNFLSVGNFGSGSLTITDSGSVRSGVGYIGNYKGGQGAVTVSGSGWWNNGSYLYVGYEGSGSLTITDSGSVGSASSAIGAAKGIQGAVTVSGSGYWNNTGDLHVGFSGSGSLTITDSGSVRSNYGYIGYNANGQGSVTVNGNGYWNNTTSLYVGYEGSGSLLITDSGSVRSNYGCYIGYGTNSRGSATISGSGYWNNTTNLYVGNQGGGSLTIMDSGSVGSNYGYIGYGTNSQGSVTVSGSGYWHNSGNLYVGNQGGGSLMIMDSGLVGSANSLVGFDSGSRGSVTVSGSGYWNNGFDLIVGYGGSGSLLITDSGSVSSKSGYIGYGANSYGSVTVGGSGCWNTANLNVGHSGSGNLHIADQGSVSSTNSYIYIGKEAGSQGSVTVSGSGYWNNTGNLYVGNSGSGALIVRDWGRVNVGGAYSQNASSTLDVMLTAGRTDAYVSSGTAILGGTLNITGVSGTVPPTASELDDNRILILQTTSGISGDFANIIIGGDTSTADYATLSVAKSADGRNYEAGLYLTWYTGTATAHGNFTVADTFTVDVPLVDRSAETFNSAWDGNSLTKLGDGTLVLSATNTYSGSTAIQAGTLRLAAADAIQNSSVSVDNGAVFNLGGFDQTITSLTNNGLVDFHLLGHQLTISGNLDGNGVFRIDTDIAAGTADTIEVQGTSSGSHNLLITNSGGAPTGSEAPLLLVQTSDGLAAFSGSVGVDSGMYRYNYTVLNGDSLGLSANDWYLALTGSGGPVPPVISPEGDAVLNSAAALSGFWFTQLDNLNKRLGELRYNTPHSSSTHPELVEGLVENIWVRSYGQQANIHTGINGVKGFRETQYGVDLGTDKAWLLDDNNTLYTGVFAGYGGADRDFHTGYNGNTDSGYGGLYGTWIHKDGWYADTVAKGQYFNSSFDGTDHGAYDSVGVGLSLELGRQFQFKDGWFAEPSLQVGYVHLTNDNYTTIQGMQVDLSDTDVIQFYGGARLGRNIKLNDKGWLQPYVKVGGLEQISSGGQVRAEGGEWRPNVDGARGVIGAGVAWQLDDSNQLHLDYEASFGDKYDKPWGLNFGYRHQF
jgi:outer membrane autotransporter protein